MTAPGRVDAEVHGEIGVRLALVKMAKEDLPVGPQLFFFALSLREAEGLADHADRERAVGGLGGVALRGRRLVGLGDLAGLLAGAVEFFEVEAESVDEPVAKTQAAGGPVGEEIGLGESAGEEALDDVGGFARPTVALPMK